MHLPDIRLVTPDTTGAIAATREIFREYAASLAIDLGFQHFEEELAALPGEYAPPNGVLILAYLGDELAGCGALRPFADADDANACEMKRLYVRDRFRGCGLGRQITQALLDRAIEAGYSSMLLDTLDDMAAARGLYGALGFEEIPPYYWNPVPGAHYFKAELGAASPSRL